MDDSSWKPPARPQRDYRISRCGRFEYRCLYTCYYNCSGDEKCEGDRRPIPGAAFDQHAAYSEYIIYDGVYFILRFLIHIFRNGVR